MGRKSGSRVWLRNVDRLIFVWMYRLFPSILNAITVVKPETVIRWHRRGFRAYWRWKSRRRGGLCLLKILSESKLERVGQQISFGCEQTEPLRPKSHTTITGT